MVVIIWVGMEKIIVHPLVIMITTLLQGFAFGKLCSRSGIILNVQSYDYAETV